VQKKNRYVLLSLFLTVNLLAFLAPTGATHIKRPESYRDLANVLISHNINPDSNFILPIRISLLDKYYYIKGERYGLYSLNGEACQKTYLTPQEMIDIRNKNDLYESYRRFLSVQNFSDEFEDYIIKHYVKHSKKDLVVIDDLGICMFSDEALAQILKADERVYKGFPIQFLRLSKLENNLIKVLSKNMELKKSFLAGSWMIYVYSAK